MNSAFAQGDVFPKTCMVNAIREIVEVHNRQIVLTLPQQFQQIQVEVIILPLRDDREMSTVFAEPPQKVNYAEYFGISNIGKAALDQELHDLRTEWERVCI